MPALQELCPGDKQKLGESCQAHLGGRCSGREAAKPRVSGRSQNGECFPHLPICHCISRLAVSVHVAECHPEAVGAQRGCADAQGSGRTTVLVDRGGPGLGRFWHRAPI